MDILLSLVGFGAIAVAWGHYLSTIPVEKVPARPVIHSAIMAVGLVLLLLSFSRSMSNGDSLLAPLLLSLFGIMLAGLFYYLLSIAGLPDGQLTVRVGQSLPSFQAMDDRGVPVNSQTWRGQRTLLKFFRGSW